MEPPHPIDKTRLQRYVTSRRVCHAISAAYSTKLNPRNLEVDYYPPYTHTFSDLVDFDFHGALTIRQQYDIWLSKATLDLYKLPQQAFDSLNDADFVNKLFNSADNSAEEDQGEVDPEMPMPAPLDAAAVDVAPPPHVTEEDGAGENPELPLLGPLDAPLAAAADVAPPPRVDRAGFAQGEEGPDPLPAPLDGPRLAAPASVAPPPPPEHDPLALTEHIAQAAEGEDSGVPAQGRPRRERKAPAQYPDGWIASEAVKAILNPDKPLTAEEQIRALKNLVKQAAAAAEDPRDAQLADASKVTMATVADDNGKDLFPDLLICHTHTAEMQEPESEDKVFGWDRRMRLKVLHHCFLGIMEIKGGPSRSLRGSKLNTRVRSLLARAEEELYEYVRICFTRDLCADSAIAISAAGPYWRWIQVERAEVEAGILETTALYDKARAFQDRFAQAPIWALGSDESDKELDRMRGEALIPIIEKHATYPSTMVPNPTPAPKPKSKRRG
ncbi:hypothetical protein OH76DRAFT_1487747 [Lentinus brumalis]|uniref:Uncharacterized protein n=1 Tax=Lentinus brumalis TaxID=2498619 RepID=A0A371CTK6_9APHY|nr:hypothetical protein OH76DRAFT_1487747 [Polyporus brumalis]